MHDLTYARRWAANGCCEEVTRDGELQPCESDAVAVKVDPEYSPYPVCAYHAHQPMVPLADLLGSSDA